LLDCLEGGERCVCQLQEVVRVAPNLLSYHLRVLREAGLVAARRRGRWVDYRLCEEALEAARASVPRAASGA
jgi:ArsR family transcriptional regulator